MSEAIAGLSMALNGFIAGQNESLERPVGQPVTLRVGG